ncbi:MAG: hypothetical protein H6627_05295 [Calditrichae bacterium]|nr:hypothetical protein [Calditrichota bacterium]MCB9057959.1 hypothetical protein [Calditrichia bacterium]
MSQISINKQEARIILTWYDTVVGKASHYGTAEYVFPEEQLVVDKLKKCLGNTSLDHYELQTVIGWMDKVISQFPGQAEYYFPEEEALVQKIRDAV